MVAELDDLAERQGISRGQLIRAVLQAYITEHKEASDG